MTIKAIETKYAGCRFRSRLEARWAVFFDALGIAWEYEKEGYDLGDGIRYLPDFWLVKSQRWAEVKPFGFDHAAIKKCLLLASESRPVLLLDGRPDCRTYKELDSPFEDTSRSAVDNCICLGMTCFMYDVGLLPDRAAEALLSAINYSEWAETFDYRAPEYIRAVATARSARFEHGEAG